MNNFFLRTESIKPEDILKLSVFNAADKSILEALKSNEPCLLEGSRGTGKSFLMRSAELELENDSKSSCVTVFVSFNMSSLINTKDNLQFYHWMMAKTLKYLVNKLRKKGYIVSSLTANLLSNDENNTENAVEVSLDRIVKLFEDSYKRKESIDVSALPDIEDVKEAIQLICEENGLDRVVFFFDEAAHVFRPEQQRQFFNLFKDFRSPYITCNAAIYPGVTHFGDSFEPIHDCIYKKIERNISDSDYLQYFRDIVFKQSDKKLQSEIDEHRGLFNTLALSSGGNPRMLLRTIQDMSSFKTNNVNTIIKSFYRNQIWSEHTDLGEKYKGHRGVIDWGRDFLESSVIPRVEEYNKSRKEKGMKESTIYFWIHKDSPEVVKESLRLLTYTGIIRKIDDGSIRATRGELGTRYEIKYGCMLALESNPNNESPEFYKNLSIKKFPEFGKNHPTYSGSENLLRGDDEQQYEEALRCLLEKSIDVLVALTPWQKDKLKSAGIHTIEDLHNNSEESLIEKIYGVGKARSRIMKNAAVAELLEYLSG